MNSVNNKTKEIANLSKIAGGASLLQLLLVVAFSLVATTVGPRPQTATEAFNAFEIGKLYGLIKDEILIVVMLSLYFITFSALYFILKDHRFNLTLFATLFTFVAITMSIASSSAFSLMHLSEQFHASSDLETKSRLLAAGDAVISKNMWNSTSSYFCGFLLQGAGVMISIAMIKSNNFMKITIISGLLSNGLDLIQHAIHHSLPKIAEPILMVAGLFYFIWYIVLAVDLLKYAKNQRINIKAS